MQFAAPDAGHIVGAFFALLGVLSGLVIGVGWVLKRLAVFLEQKTAARRSSGAENE